MRKPKIIIKKAGKKKGQCMVVVVAANGKVLLTSEILNSKRNALKNVDAASDAFDQFVYFGIDLTDELSK